MPYEGEYAGYRSIRRLVGAEAVQQLLKRARVAPPNANQNSPTPSQAPEPSTKAPAFVVGIRRKLQRGASQKWLSGCSCRILHRRQRAYQLEIDRST